MGPTIQPAHSFVRRRCRRRAAFSLVEMMIALVILGFGLLVVGAALPVGMDYARKTTDASMGADAAEYGIDVVLERVRTSPDILKDGLFQPRAPVAPFPPWTPPPPLSPWNGPFIKVRPLALTNIDATPDTQARAYQYDDFESVIARHPLAVARGNAYVPPNVLAEFNDGSVTSGVVIQAALSPAERVFPAITPDDPLTVSRFFNAPYAQRRLLSPELQDLNGFPGAETLKALERLVAWTCFYRRASWAPDSDPHVYELIVVATKRPTDRHRYPRQDWTVPAPRRVFRQPSPFALYANGQRGVNGADRLLPVPWLVTFRDLPDVIALGLLDPANLANLNGPRVLNGPNANAPPANLEFGATLRLGELLPPGSIFIPAVNDYNVRGASVPGEVGFVPHTPDSVPVYEVVDRIRDDANDRYRIIVRNPGVYPWVDPSKYPGAGAADAWPVWIIPPAVRTESGLDHVFEARTPVIGVARRYVRFPEVP